MYFPDSGNEFRGREMYEFRGREKYFPDPGNEFRGREMYFPIQETNFAGAK